MCQSCVRVQIDVTDKTTTSECARDFYQLFSSSRRTGMVFLGTEVPVWFIPAQGSAGMAYRPTSSTGRIDISMVYRRSLWFLPVFYGIISESGLLLHTEPCIRWGADRSPRTEGEFLGLFVPPHRKALEAVAAVSQKRLETGLKVRGLSPSS